MKGNTEAEFCGGWFHVIDGWIEHAVFAVSAVIRCYSNRTTTIFNFQSSMAKVRIPNSSPILILVQTFLIISFLCIHNQNNDELQMNRVSVFCNIKQKTLYLSNEKMKIQKRGCGCFSPQKSLFFIIFSCE